MTSMVFRGESSARLSRIESRPPATNVSNAWSLFDDAGEQINEGTTEFLRGYGAQFSAWIETIAPAAATAKAA